MPIKKILLIMFYFFSLSGCDGGLPLSIPVILTIIGLGISNLVKQNAEQKQKEAKKKQDYENESVNINGIVDSLKKSHRLFSDSILTENEFNDRKKNIFLEFENKIVRETWEDFIIKFIPLINEKIITNQEFKNILKYVDKSNTELEYNIIEGLKVLNNIFISGIIDPHELKSIKENLIGKIDRYKIPNIEDFLLDISEIAKTGFLNNNDIEKIKNKLL
ncbi:MAG TPA: hypothetical protein PKY81_16830 [bacterium]|nr:hypothetical protein [bacterium]